MDVGTDSAERHVEALGDLLVRQVLQEGEAQHLVLGRTQQSEGVMHDDGGHHGVADRVLRALGAGEVDDLRLHLPRLTSTAGEHVGDDATGDARQPPAERPGGIVGVPRAPRPREHLLGGVLGVLPAAQRGETQGEDQATVALVRLAHGDGLPRGEAAVEPVVLKHGTPLPRCAASARRGPIQARPSDRLPVSPRREWRWSRCSPCSPARPAAIRRRR